MILGAADPLGVHELCHERQPEVQRNRHTLEGTADDCRLANLWRVGSKLSQQCDHEHAFGARNDAEATRNTSTTAITNKSSLKPVGLFRAHNMWMQMPGQHVVRVVHAG